MLLLWALLSGAASGYFWQGIGFVIGIVGLGTNQGLISIIDIKPWYE